GGSAGNAETGGERQRGNKFCADHLLHPRTFPRISPYRWVVANSSTNAQSAPTCASASCRSCLMVNARLSLACGPSASETRHALVEFGAPADSLQNLVRVTSHLPNGFKLIW